LSIYSSDLAATSDSVVQFLRARPSMISDRDAVVNYVCHSSARRAVAARQHSLLARLGYKFLYSLTSVLRCHAHLIYLLNAEVTPPTKKSCSCICLEENCEKICKIDA